jgi:hypothetical protein
MAATHMLLLPISVVVPVTGPDSWDNPFGFWWCPLCTWVDLLLQPACWGYVFNQSSDGRHGGVSTY